VRRTLILLALLVGALVTPGAASADPVPGIDQDWPMCGSAPDDDGLYCIVSMTKNGVAITEPPAGTWQLPYIDLIGGGDVRFGVENHTVGSGSTTSDVPPGDAYVVTVNTGPIKPRELYGRIREVSFARGGGPPGGYTFTLGFKPTPVAFLLFGSCDFGACGDDTTVADTVYNGFVTGYVTDLASSGLDAAEIAARSDYVHAYNAQVGVLPFYDFDTNALVIRLANPHLRSAGVVATGSYETFLPNALLTTVMNVPDPTSLTGGAVTVDRTAGGTPTSVPFTLTHEAGGVRIEIPSITYSSPRYRIKLKRTAPGKPRLYRASRLTKTSVKLQFLKPLANGGASVTKYVARCRRPGGPWFLTSGTRSPLTLEGLPRRPVTCSVRAINKIGKGLFSASRTA
jgi:hypothetical protein